MEDIIQAGEDIVGGIEELFTDPGEALDDVEVVLYGVFICDLLDECSPPSTTSTSTSLDPAASWSSSCQNATAAAATTMYTPIHLDTAAMTGSLPGQPSYEPISLASPTRPTEQADWASISFTRRLHFMSANQVGAESIVASNTQA